MVQETWVRSRSRQRLSTCLTFYDFHIGAAKLLLLILLLLLSLLFFHTCVS